MSIVLSMVSLLILVSNNCITDLVKSLTCENTLIFVELESIFVMESSCFSLLIASSNLSNLDVGRDVGCIVGCADGNNLGWRDGCEEGIAIDGLVG